MQQAFEFAVYYINGLKYFTAECVKRSLPGESVDQPCVFSCDFACWSLDTQPEPPANYKKIKHSNTKYDYSQTI